MARKSPAAPAPKLAYKISEATEVTPFGRDKLREYIASGRLKARRDLDTSGEPVGPFIILHADLVAFLDSLEAA